MLEVSDRQVLFGTKHRRMVNIFDGAQQWSLEFCHGDMMITVLVPAEQHAYALTDIQLPDDATRRLYDAMREYYGDA